MSYWNHPNDQGSKVGIEVTDDYRLELLVLFLVDQVTPWLDISYGHWTLKNILLFPLLYCLLCLQVAEGSISLFSSSSQSVKPVKRDSCARPYTFELVSGIQTAQQNDQLALAK